MITCVLRKDAWEDAVIAVGSCSHVYPMLKFNADHLLLSLPKLKFQIKQYRIFSLYYTAIYIYIYIYSIKRIELLSITSVCIMYKHLLNALSILKSVNSK